MWPDQVSNQGPRTYQSGALPTVLCGPAQLYDRNTVRRAFKLQVFHPSCCQHHKKENDLCLTLDTGETNTEI